MYMHNTLEVVIDTWPQLTCSCMYVRIQVMPPFLSVIRTCDRGMREYLFKQLGQIVSIIKQHARNYMPEIFSIIRVHIRVNANYMLVWIQLISRRIHTFQCAGVLESNQPHPKHHHTADWEDSGCHGWWAEGVYSSDGSADAPPLPAGLQRTKHDHTKGNVN